MKTPILGADFLSHFNVSVNMATRSLVDCNTEQTAKGITSIYQSTGICAAMPDANGLQELITKFPTLTTPFKHSDCDSKFFRITKRDFIFAHVNTGQVGT